MRLLHLLMFTFLCSQFSLAQGWKKTEPTPPIELPCGVLQEASTWGNENQFSNYACLGTDSPSYIGNEVVYQFSLTEITDVRFTFESNCEIGIFLLDANMECIDYNEINPLEHGTTKSFLGALRLLPGDFFLIVDRPDDWNMCDVFTLKMDCTPYEPYTLCELGGEITSCNHTVTDMLAEEVQLPPLPENSLNFDLSTSNILPCEPDKSFKIYQAYFDNPGTITTQLLNATPGTEVFIYTDECACKSDFLCFDGADCEGVGFGEGTLNNAVGGFYYFVVTGPPAATYDLKVVTNDCICDYVAEPIECGQAITADAGTETNKFDNVVGRGANIYSDCYGRDRPYTGGDKVYEFEIFEPHKVSIKLTSFFNAGLFLFDANCGTDCLGSGETFGINGTTTIDSIHLQRGVYQIIVDLEKAHAASCPFTIEITDCTPQPPYIVADFDETPLVHYIDIIQNIPYNSNRTTLGGNLSAEISFFAAGDFCDNVPVNEEIGVGGARVEAHELYGKNFPEDEAYDGGEPFKQKLTIRGRSLGFVDGAFGELRSFDDGNSSILDFLSSITAGGGVVIDLDIFPIDQKLSSLGGTTSFDVFINDSRNQNTELDIDWCVKQIVQAMTDAKIQIDAIRPSNTGRGKKQIFIDYGPNSEFSEKRCTVRIAGSTISKNKDLIFIQESKSCEDNEDPPAVGCNQSFMVTLGSRSIGSVGAFYNFIESNTDIVSDDCTDNEDLTIRYPNFNLTFPLELGTHTLTLDVTDGDNNNTNCRVNIEVVDPTNRIAPIQPTISVSNELTPSNNPITIAPNPSSGVFDLLISSSIKDEYRLSIKNTLGQEIRKIELDNTQNIDLKNFATGIYFVQLKTKNQSYLKKLILTK